MTIEYTVSGTASGGGVDYTETTASPLVISVGSLEGLIDLTVVDDALDELDELLVLTARLALGGRRREGQREHEGGEDATHGISPMSATPR